MAGCNCGDKIKFEGLSATYKRILWIVIAINASMFVVEFSFSFIAHSKALQADALDFLGDTLTYTITFLVIGHSAKWRTRAALFKGFSLLLMGIWVFAATVYAVFFSQSPNENIMLSVAISAFLANLISALLLMKYRDGDAINNLLVILAAGVVYLTHSRWPDLIVAFLMSALFLHSASLIIKQALEEQRSYNKNA